MSSGEGRAILLRQGYGGQAFNAQLSTFKLGETPTSEPRFPHHSLSRVHLIGCASSIFSVGVRVRRKD